MTRLKPIKEIIRSVLRKAVLRAHLRELEARVSSGCFDRELSARIDCVRYLLDEHLRERVE